jgi:hypothetical protein
MRTCLNDAPNQKQWHSTSPGTPEQKYRLFAHQNGIENDQI